ncbi:TetR family transcriptional regulator [Microbacterium sp. A84]|uniref:TetR family transcriptional regulator n=1 Tax=Microbacterium sp. A84 TaxID=3450715 RepID=UPI003F442940
MNTPRIPLGEDAAADPEGALTDVTQAEYLPLDAIAGLEAASTAQKARYLRTLNASLALIDEVGVQGVTMEGVCASSGVALATIYRYFQSRDKLLYVASNTWVRYVAGRVRRNTPVTEPLSHLLAAMRAGRDEYRTHLPVIKAWALLRLSVDEHARGVIRHESFYNDLNSYSLAGAGSPELLADLTLIMENMWLALLTRWALGEGTYDDVADDMERSVVLVFRAHGWESMDRTA